MNPATPDGRYFVVKGKLWRCSNPALDEFERQRLVNALMAARRAVKAAKASGNPDEMKAASSDSGGQGLAGRARAGMERRCTGL